MRQSRSLSIIHTYVPTYVQAYSCDTSLKGTFFFIFLSLSLLSYSFSRSVQIETFVSCTVVRARNVQQDSRLGGDKGEKTLLENGRFKVMCVWRRLNNMVYCNISFNMKRIGRSDRSVNILRSFCLASIVW